MERSKLSSGLIKSYPITELCEEDCTDILQTNIGQNDMEWKFHMNFQFLEFFQKTDGKIY